VGYISLPHRGKRALAGEIPKYKPGLSGLGACCARCARTGGSCGGGLGDDMLPVPTAPAAPADLNTMVADIRNRADQYVTQDRYFRVMQIGATLAIPLAAAVWKFILGRRQGTTLVG